VTIRNRRIVFLFMVLIWVSAVVSGWNRLEAFGSEVTQLDRALVVAFAAGILVAVTCNVAAQKGASSRNGATSWKELARGSKPADRAARMVWMWARAGRYSFFAAMLILPVLVIRIAWLKSRLP